MSSILIENTLLKKILEIPKYIPNSYGEGILFAYSGIEGEIDYENQVVGTTIEPSHGTGMFLYLPDTLVLMAETTYTNWTHMNPLAVMNDVMVFDINKSNLVFFADSTNTLAGCSPADIGIHLIPKGDDQSLKIIQNNTEITQIIGTNNVYVLVKRYENDMMYFGFAAVSMKNGDNTKASSEALRLAKQSSIIDLEDAVNARIANYTQYVSNSIPNELKPTYTKCVSILKSSVNSANQLSPYKWLTPSRSHFKLQWLWDSVFQMIGITKVWPQIAAETLLSVFHYQQQDGFIPHMMSPESVSDIIQPPLLGWGSWIAYQANKDKGFLLNAYHYNNRFLKWVIWNRSNNGGMLGFKINPDWRHIRCDESGMDNSTRFDKHFELDCIDLCCYVKNDIDYMKLIEEELGINPDLQLHEYSKILSDFIINDLWDPKSNMFYDRCPNSGLLTGISSCASFLPLWANAATNDQAEHLVAHLLNSDEFWTAMPLPSITRNHPAYSTDYWRGAVWLNLVQMVVIGLENYGYKEAAQSLAQKMLYWIDYWHSASGCIYECYDPDGKLNPEYIKRRSQDIEYGFMPKTSYGVVRNFGWTASAFICLADYLYERN